MNTFMTAHGMGKEIKVCPICKKEFFAWRSQNRIYCSYSCAGKIPKRKIVRFLKRCSECNIQYLVKRHRVESSKYCSAPCKNKNLPKGESHPKWKGGVPERPYRVRKAINIAKKIKGKCERCGSIENLHGHHIIKYSESKDLSDELRNIEVICAICHALEHPEMANILLSPKRRGGINRNCNECNNEYYIPKYKIKTSKWCSRECQMKGIHKLNTGRVRNGKMDTKSCA